MILVFAVLLGVVRGCIHGSLQWKCSGESCVEHIECETNECIKGVCTYSEGLTWWAVILLIGFCASLVLLFLIVCYQYCYRKITEYNNN